MNIIGFKPNQALFLSENVIGIRISIFCLENKICCLKCWRHILVHIALANDFCNCIIQELVLLLQCKVKQLCVKLVLVKVSQQNNTVLNISCFQEKCGKNMKIISYFQTFLHNRYAVINFTQLIACNVSLNNGNSSLRLY